MLIFRGSLLTSKHIFRFYGFVRRIERAAKKTIRLNQFITTSGYLIAGCCFSRQSDKDGLLPESKNENLDNQTVYNTNTVTRVQPVRSFCKMKRSSDSCEGENVDHLAETSNKRPKFVDNETNDVEEVHPVTTTSPVIEDAELFKAKSAVTEKKKPDTDVEKPKKHRPNYFVAIKISDSQIIKTLNELQQHMLERDERLKKSMIQLATLHITLMVMYIGDSETHARAIKTLENIHQEHNDDFSTNPLKLEFRGLSHFQNRVLYAKLSADDSYKRLSMLAESVKKHYENASISSADSKTDFTPHLTIAKIRDVRKKKKEQPKKINPGLYKEYSDQYFGSQEVQSLQLLSMTDPKDEVGYYSGKEIYFSAFEPEVRRDYLNKLLKTEEKKKDVKEMINALMKEKLK